LVARNLLSHQFLVKALEQRQITREYEAIVHGVMTTGGSIDAPIGRHRIHRTHMSVTSTGRPAVTHYRIIQRFRTQTHVRLFLETGRTHQIRVHLAHIHYPILGDGTYGKQPLFPPQPLPALKEAIIHFKRQALHARRLQVMHPTKDIMMEWHAPLPEDMALLLKYLHDDLGLTQHQRI
jgi:23S rRNA pseudouridine1911/1915/1917 synthase